MEEIKNKKLYYLLIALAVIIPLIIGFSYAYFQTIVTGNDDGVESNSASKINIDLVTENDGYINANGISLINVEDIAEKSEKADFKVVSGNNNHYINYGISLSHLTISNNLQVDDFKWQLLKNNNIVANGNFQNATGNSMNLLSDLTIGANKTDQLQLRIWIEEKDENQIDLLNGSFSAKITLTADMNQNPIVNP